MLKTGSIIFSQSKGQIMSQEAVNKLRNTFTRDELFNIAWGSLVNPWLENGYATLDLRTGDLEGNNDFSMRGGTPHLILFKVSLESLSADDILTDKEFGEYDKDDQTIEQFCKEYKIDVKQRTKIYYQSHWEKIGWYIDSVIDENLYEYYNSCDLIESHQDILDRCKLVYNLND